MATKTNRMKLLTSWYCWDNMLTEDLIGLLRDDINAKWLSRVQVHLIVIMKKIESTRVLMVIVCH
jgi:hypothetical protein